MPTRPVPIAHLCLALLYLAVLILSFAAMDGGLVLYEAVAGPARVAFGLIGLTAAVKAAREADLPARTRQAWWVVSAGFAVLAATPPVLVLLDAGDLPAGADVAHLAFVGLVLVALSRFPLRATNRRGRWMTALDACTVVVGGSMVLWYTAFGPYLRDHDLSIAVPVTASLYPVVDLALLFTVARVLMHGTDRSSQRALRPLAAGALVLFVGDAIHIDVSQAGSLTAHSSWQFVCWMTGDALLAAAALEQVRQSVRARPAGRRGRNVSRYLPYLAVVVAHALMLDAAVRDGEFFPWGGLAVGGALLSALVLARQTLVQRESDERSVTDHLTGLANRSRVRSVSERSLARNARTGRHTAVLVIDMNGFKGVNDTLGHAAGDQLLAEFAELLRRCVPRPGLPARLGGDEFAVVLPDLTAPERAYDVAGRIAAELAPVLVEGRLVPMAASIGVAVSGPGELSHDEVVNRADQAMYRAKRHAPDTRWAAWRESDEPEPLPAAA
ncbi:GGDEF domain-containing protein [Paractinoplanes rishiriensis]|uniref:GGDEF domain-containing protein n=1 Tax=Paractinoplanes rishiriensis TaxID=1050105 RepID=A0A919JSY8_9ACTN|nr:GGDEF domain-containing protein [Actinoplanes rishiriensis]GIE94606.1 hypothetical protein Ari01nite_20710 [Actinoplanes rishiriensis]